MKDETIQRKPRRARPLDRSPDQQSNTGRSGNKQSNELRAMCVAPLAVAICIPLLALFALVAVVMTVARAIPEITDWILRPY